MEQSKIIDTLETYQQAVLVPPRSPSKIFTTLNMLLLKLYLEHLVFIELYVYDLWLQYESLLVPIQVQ